MNGFRMTDIRRSNREHGWYFFERRTMRFFDSHVERGVYQGIGGVFFITSEQFHGSVASEPRKFTVRQFQPETGDVDTVGKFNEIRTLWEARSYARLCASGLQDRIHLVALEETGSHAPTP